MEIRSIAEQKIREKGMVLTKARVDIFEYILRNMNHPSCEEIYEDLKPKNKSLSIATVYNVTERLCQDELVIKLIAPNGDMHFDGTLEFHGHFYCRECGRIFDFDCDMPDLSKKLPGFITEQHEIKTVGLCSDCKDK